MKQAVVRGNVRENHLTEENAKDRPKWKRLSQKADPDGIKPG